MSLGKYCRTRPFMFSLEPRCHGLCGSQKYTAIPVALASSLCLVISRPWSYVTLWRNTSHLGNVSTPLTADGARLAVEHGSNVAQTVVLLEQAGHGHAFFGLELLVVPG